MTKIKAMLAAAASLVIGGLAIGIALNQAGQQLGVSAQEWCSAVATAGDVQKREHFLLAYQPGNPIPEAWPDGPDGRILGECSGGTCTIAPAALPDCAYTYQYDCGPQVVGWRVCDVWAHPYVAKGWKLAAADLAYLRWFGSFAEASSTCLANFTGQQCLQLFDADRKCWLLGDGRVCRFGKLLTDGTACPYGQVAAQMPCTVYRGAGSELDDAQRVWTDEEMDEL